MKLAGFPAQISFSGIDFVTTLPAPIIELLPIVTPFNIIELAPMNTYSPILMGLVFTLLSPPCLLTMGSKL
jgi:hypothetical protein